MRHTLKIPIFKLNYEDEFIKKYQDGVYDILSTGFIGEGKYVREFERKFSELTKSDNSVACTSGTDAIELAIRSLNISHGEIIMPSNTFFATAVAVKNCGCDPVLADCSIDDLSLDPKEVRRLITEKTKAVIVVHVGGILSSRLSEIKKICDTHNLPLIEDAAHAHGSYSEIGYAGTIGDIGCFSFFPTKVMTTGEGGMVTTNNDLLANVVRSLKNFGRDNNDASRCIITQGMNSKINDLTGLLGSLECDRVLDRVQKRNSLLEIYKSNLNNNFKVVTQDGGRCCYYKCIALTENADAVRDAMRKNNITPTGEVYSNPVHHQKVFLQSGLPNTDWVAKNHVCPPLYPELTPEEVEYICSIMNGV